jgi:predicted Zn-dependent protease
LSTAIAWGVAGCGGQNQPAPAIPVESAVPEAKAPAKPAGTVAERIARAKDLMAEGDLEGAIVALDEAMLIDPADRGLLGMLVRAYGEAAAKAKATDPAKFYRYNVTCGGYMRELRDKFKDLTDEEKQLIVTSLRNEASAHAKSLRVEETSGTLRELKSAGFTDFESLRNDPDWTGILKVDQFRTIFDEVAGKS